MLRGGCDMSDMQENTQTIIVACFMWRIGLWRWGRVRRCLLLKVMHKRGRGPAEKAKSVKGPAEIKDLMLCRMRACTA